MTATKLLESVRRVEMRTNRLVNNRMVGAYLSHFNGGNYGEFAIIKTPADKSAFGFNCLEFDGIGNSSKSYVSLLKP